MTTNPTRPRHDDDIVLTVSEAAKKLKISDWTANRLIQSGDLGSIQIGARRLVPSADLADYLDRKRNARPEPRHGK